MSDAGEMKSSSSAKEVKQILIVMNAQTQDIITNVSDLELPLDLA